jgi:osmotically-inducible protein OsmY
MDGINTVDNQLRVDPMLVVVTVIESEPNYAVFVADATLESMIESKLLWNEYTDSLDIKVSSSAGVVTLTGRADTENSRALALALAVTTPGVALVNNLLTVDKSNGQVVHAADGDNALSDAWIAARTRSTLNWDNTIDSSGFKITVTDGVVRVSGEVATAAERQRAIEAAQHIRGVKRVDASGLTVETNSESVAQQ